MQAPGIAYFIQVISNPVSLCSIRLWVVDLLYATLQPGQHISQVLKMLLEVGNSRQEQFRWVLQGAYVQTHVSINILFCWYCRVSDSQCRIILSCHPSWGLVRQDWTRGWKMAWAHLYALAPSCPKQTHQNSQLLQLLDFFFCRISVCRPTEGVRFGCGSDWYSLRWYSCDRKLPLVIILRFIAFIF